MDEATRRFVRERAQGRCEYCQLPESATPFLSFHTEHILARQHEGSDDADNLAMACERCNAYKGPNLTGIDPVTGVVTRLFHPRKDSWATHFCWNVDGTISGLTDVGRTTSRLLKMNDARRVQLRQEIEIQPHPGRPEQ